MDHTLVVFETSHQSRILAEISEIQCPRSSLMSFDIRLSFWNFGRLKSKFNSWKVVVLSIERVNLKGNGGEMIIKLKLECKSYILVVSLDLKALAEHSLYPVSFFFFFFNHWTTMEVPPNVTFNQRISNYRIHGKLFALVMICFWSLLSGSGP